MCGCCTCTVRLLGSTVLRWCPAHVAVACPNAYAHRYYYVSLALRENILRVNGSNIRPWWITHHYLSSFMSIVLLTWPEGENYNKFLPQFNLCVAPAVQSPPETVGDVGVVRRRYCLCQGVVQMMQAAYQKKRLYIRKAIGKVRGRCTR